MLTDERLREIRERAAKATLGAWQYVRPDIPDLLAEVDRLRLALAGEEKARALLSAGMESQCELMDELKQARRAQDADLAACRAVVTGFAARIVAQSEILSKRAEKEG